MRKFISIIALAALFLTAIQTAQAQVFTSTTDSGIVARDADTGVPILKPVEMSLMVHNGTAVVSYEDINGVHEFTGKAYEADEGFVFSGLEVTMPAGDRLVFCFAEPVEGRFDVTAGYSNDRMRLLTIPFIRPIPEA